MEEESIFNSDGKSEFQYSENETRPLYLIMHKAKLKMDQGPQHKSPKLLKENVGSFLSL